jgi:tetratricopeptide (TPR) repeat protein
VYVLSPGSLPPVGEIDPRCVTKTNEIYRPTPYQASARSWTPGDELWAAIKKRSAGRTANVTVVGLSSGDVEKVVSRGRIRITTSEDPVGAPIFYRDVPLAPSVTQEGVIKPLSDDAVPLIAWRLRDVSKPTSRLLLTDVPTCTNCHSFSADGKTLGMDLDGPQGDKGAYVIASVSREMVIEPDDVISWNSFPEKPADHKTIGFLSQMSPDGQCAVTTLNEEVFVTNFTDYKFLQVFYPTRGILGYYRRATGEIKALPGADDPKYVHCDPAWYPDGESLVFARAEARDAYVDGRERPKRPNDPAETQIRYGLYRIPFNGGRGGEPEPIVGASANGMSNTFPKVSPDGKWIVFVQCRNGQLMRPDSKLWIVPAAGGPARLMRCNTWRMNSWHSFSPNGRWMVFSSKANTPYTQMFLTHIDEEGSDGPAILIPNATAANRAVNLPEFVNVPYERLVSIRVPALDHVRDNLRGIELTEGGKYDEAIAAFEEAIRSQPDYMEAHVLAATALAKKGELEEAVARLEEVLELDPKNWLALGNLGVILAMQGKPDEAVDRLRTAVRLHPTYADGHCNLAMVLREKGMLEDATVHFRMATKLDVENAANYYRLAHVLFEQEMFEEAHVCAKKALELDPEFVDARLILGNILAVQGELERAAAQFESAYERHPDSLRVVNELAWLLATCSKDAIRDGARAVELAEKACRNAQFEEPVLMRTLAAAYAESGRWSEAVATAARALELARPRGRLMTESIGEQLELYRQGKPVRWP